jgi:Regulator of volume decrease after cellular swelling
MCDRAEPQAVASSRGLAVFGIMSSNNETAIQWKQAANLSLVRASFKSSSEFASNAALQQFLDPEERILLGPIHVTRRQQTTVEFEPSGNGDARDSCQGRFVITSERLLFWGDESDDNDAIVPAECIDLHAIASASTDADDEANPDQDASTSLYLQIRSDSECSEPDLIEWTVVPRVLPPDTHEAAIQPMFDALSELISLHPIDPNDDMDDDSDEDEMIVAPSYHADSGVLATLEEREAMLDRLDRLLVVPKELERNDDAAEYDDGKSTEDTAEGQFDDADDDEVDALL